MGVGNRANNAFGNPVSLRALNSSPRPMETMHMTYTCLPHDPWSLVLGNLPMDAGCCFVLHACIAIPTYPKKDISGTTPFPSCLLYWVGFSWPVGFSSLSTDSPCLTSGLQRLHHISLSDLNKFNCTSVGVHDFTT